MLNATLNWLLQVPTWQRLGKKAEMKEWLFVAFKHASDKSMVKTGSRHGITKMRPRPHPPCADESDEENRQRNQKEDDESFDHVQSRGVESLP
jgi:hypothetical protein